MQNHVLENFDDEIMSPEFLNDPYPVFHRLRESQPVYWCEPLNCWLLTDFDIITASFKDYEHFSNAHRFSTMFQKLPPDLRAEIQPLEEHYTGIGLIHSDPPDHTRLRRLIHLAFTPSVIRKMRGQVEEIVDMDLERVRAQGHMDVVGDLAFPLPATVIATMLGVPIEDSELMKNWSQDAIAFQATARASRELYLHSQTALLEMKAYLKALVEDRRRNPQTDLISALVEAEDEGEKLTLDEMLSTCVTLMVAGHETTTNLIANGTLLMLRNPDVMQQLKDNPDLMPRAIEEFLRYESPIQRQWRTMKGDVEIGGQTLRQGDAVLQMLGAANRDPAHFEDPDTLDIQRHPNPHLAFGNGIHYCLGAPLARLEAPIALNCLLERMPNLALATDEVEWHPGVMRSLKALPVTFDV